MTTTASEDFATLFEKSREGRELSQEGDIVSGKVIAITQDAVMIDFGHKSEGQIPVHELKGPNGELIVKVGDLIDVYVENMDFEEGLAILSKEKADALKIWDHLQEVMDKDGSIDGLVIGKIKGGMSVDIGVKAFLPLSQIDIRMPGGLDKLIGRRFKFRILKLNKRKGNIIVSRRALMEKDRDFARHEILSTLSEGQLITGMVKNLTEYGAFIDLGGIDGLLHITDMSWGRIGHPSEILQIGKDVTVKVLKIDQESGKVSLGLKQLTADPWGAVPQKYSVGSRVKGRVTNVTDYGAFVEMEQGVEGLIHISEMSWSRKVKHPSKLVNVGDLVETVVLDMDMKTRRISLGIKQLGQNPWQSVAEKFPVGTRFHGQVRNVAEFGLFIELSDEIDGLLHISDLSWLRPARPLALAFPKKSEMEVVVLSIDSENEKISLGRKQLSEDPWPRIRKEYGIGTRCRGKVTWSGDKGVAVELEASGSLSEAVEGFIGRPGLPEEAEENPAKAYSVGAEIEVVVHSLDEKERRISLGPVVVDGGSVSHGSEKGKRKVQIER